MSYFQQGDVLLRTINAIPMDAATPQDGNMVLAYGEATGHKHQLYGSAAKMILGAAIYVRVREEAKLLHEEHKALLLPPGDYAVDFVREYDHFTEEANRVKD